MCDGEFGEHFGYSILWSTCNDYLEDVQVVGLNPMLKRAQEAPLRPPHSSNASITITGSPSHGSSRLNNDVSMNFLKRRPISDELWSLLCLTKCRRKEGYKRERLQATTRQRESVVIVVDCVRSNQNYITCLFWSCS